MTGEKRKRDWGKGKRNQKIMDYRNDVITLDGEQWRFTSIKTHEIADVALIWND